ncbi:hypothetical protein E8E13_000340 [Curvularia kusanoi]|uniref:Uncharacterized protein n=1 Tax=Curvularia kusanoi TaxID=90978 RepID=A0A9P4W731_CURKU|nr:hypothetical protein E8E13_000340 [Curvularia kusanoi]
MVEVDVGIPETVTKTVCGSAGKKTDFVAGGVPSSSSSGKRLVVVTVMKTVACGLLVVL